MFVYLQQPVFKAGVVVGKKMTKQAVARNKLRRRLYSLFSSSTDTLKNTHAAILAKPNILNLSYTELEQEFQKTLQNIQ